MKVKIRTWSDMTKEFGLDTPYTINNGWLDVMEKELPNNRVIEVKKYKKSECVFVWNEWMITDEMVDDFIEEDVDDIVNKMNTYL